MELIPCLNRNLCPNKSTQVLLVSCFYETLRRFSYYLDYYLDFLILLLYNAKIPIFSFVIIKRFKQIYSYCKHYDRNNVSLLYEVIILLSLYFFNYFDLKYCVRFLPFAIPGILIFLVTSNVLHLKLGMSDCSH